jgi:hypothetical protein
MSLQLDPSVGSWSGHTGIEEAPIQRLLSVTPVLRVWCRAVRSQSVAQRIHLQRRGLNGPVGPSKLEEEGFF